MTTKTTNIIAANGDAYQVVRSADRKGWFVNLNRWDSERNCYSGNVRFSDRKFPTRSAATAYVDELAEATH